MSVSQLQEQRQDHTQNGRDQIPHGFVRAILVAVTVSIDGQLARGGPRAILLHRVHRNIPGEGQ